MLLLVVNGMVIAKLKRDKQCFSSLGKLGGGRCWGTLNAEEIFQIRTVARLRMVLGGGHTQSRNRSFFIFHTEFFGQTCLFALLPAVN